MSRRKPVTFELATSNQRKQSIRDFRRQCYSMMGRTDLLQEDGARGRQQQKLDNQLHLIEARSGDETVGTIRWGTYISVAGDDHYADSIINNKIGLPSSEPENFSRTDRLIIHPKHIGHRSGEPQRIGGAAATGDDRARAVVASESGVRPLR